MKRILMIVLLLVLAVCLIGAKPQPTPMHLVSEGLSHCGYACNYEGGKTDGCIGFDEDWRFEVRGDLGPGESYTYVSSQPMCHARTIITTSAFSKKGNPQLLVTLKVWDTEYTWIDSRMESACLVPPSGDGHGMKYWSVTVENVHHKKRAREVWLYGLAWGFPLVSHTCPF